jgi:TonB-linked SusC/RagA family outer membrane protein
MAGYSYQDFMYEYFQAKNMDFASDQFSWNNLGAGAYLKEGKATMSSGKGENTLIAFFSRATYNYDDRYLFTASLRREGSSRFGVNNKWGSFPAVSFGWRINNEGFMDHISWLNDLKIRAGYGVTGNQMSENYVSIPRINSQQYVLNGDEWILTYGPSSNPNADLKWEEKHEINIGFDFSAIDSRLGLTFDWYKRENKDLLYVVQASVPSLIYSSIWANVGDMESKGVELTFYGEPVRSKDLNLGLAVNISHNSSRLVSLSNNKYVSAAKYREFGYLGSPGILGNTIRLEEGGKVGNFYGFHYQGLTDNGKWIFEDLNDDDKITEEVDEKVIGNGVPKYFLGLTANLRYKQFDLALSMKGAFGFDILNTKEIYYGNPYTFPSNNLLISALDKHKKLNDIPQYSDYYLEKGDYLKISNLSVGYNFNTAALGQYISRIRIYAGADNLHTFTSYSGIDPEINSTGFETGVDYRGFYPRTCMLTFGLNVNF